MYITVCPWQAKEKEVTVGTQQKKEVMKYILVTGGVISGVGKGIITSSLGVILKSHGFRVSAIKIDPYINIDAGTFSPYEHGETADNRAVKCRRSCLKLLPVLMRLGGK